MNNDEYLLFKSRTRRLMSLVSNSGITDAQEEVLSSDEVDQPSGSTYSNLLEPMNPLEPRTYSELSPVKFINDTLEDSEHQQSSTSNFTSTDDYSEILRDDLLQENSATISDMDSYTAAEDCIQVGNLNVQVDNTMETCTISTDVLEVGDLNSNFHTVDVSEIIETIQEVDVIFPNTANKENIEMNQDTSIEISVQKDFESKDKATSKDGTFVMKETFINDIASDDDDNDGDYLPPRSNENSEDSEVAESPKKRRSIANEVDDTLETASIPIDGEEQMKKRSRWTKENKNMWKREKNKSLRDECLPYKDYKGTLKAKKPKEIDCSKCTYKCNEIFNEEERIILCKKYWSLSIFERKKDFILINVTSSEPKSRRPRNNNGCARSNVKQYHFYKNDIKFRVCQAFFTKTLCISNRVVINAFSGKDEQGYYASQDKRGKKSPPNKTPIKTIQKVKSHIESFPSVESHYVRKSSKRQYLDKKLSISKMYSLYVEQCKQDGDSEKKIVSEITYRRTFCNDYNYSFFHPKKDQCIHCNRYETSSIEEKANLQQDYDEHRRRHSEAQEEKRRDKERANTDDTFMSVTFDLQSVLQLPSCDVSLAYYKRKLNAFNFTIYEASAPNNGLCFFWTEIDGHRGSSEIGTCLLKYIEKLPDNIKHLTLFSDTCGGQNRNLQVAALLLNAVQIFNVDIIEQKFLESGHSFMEVDSMHSSIESKKKFMPIYCVNDYINIFKLARASKSKNNKPPYRTCQLSFSDFLDLKKLSDQLIKNKNVDEDGKKINWLKVKCFKYEKSAPNILQYKYNYSEDYARINICARRPGRRPTSSSYKLVDELKKLDLYKTQISITKQKKDDLLDLCRRGVIPEIFHPWYESLPTSDTAKEVLPIDNEEEL